MAALVRNLGSNWAMLIMMALLVGTLVWQFHPFRPDPLEIHSIEAEWHGGNGLPFLTVKIKATKHRVCPGSYSSIVRDDTGLVHQVLPDRDTFLRPGDRDAIIRFALPHLSPGRYTFETTATYGCIDGPRIVPSPPAAFVVPDEPAPPTLEDLERGNDRRSLYLPRDAEQQRHGRHQLRAERD